jgi:hypothetical protein
MRAFRSQGGRFETAVHAALICLRAEGWGNFKELVASRDVATIS